MNVQQSAKPYLILLFVLLTAIPLGNHLLQEKMDTAHVEIVIEAPALMPMADKQ